MTLRRKIFEKTTDPEHAIMCPTVVDSVSLPEADQYVWNVYEAYREHDPQVFVKFVGWIWKNCRKERVDELRHRLSDILPLSALC
jgi:hypothetical protein